MIPKGLRINKFPTFGKDNPVFQKKREAILNKCSLDLMLLLIEEAKLQQEEIRSEIAEVRSSLISNPANSEDATLLEQTLKESINELSQALTKVKLKKFKRDLQDYDDGKVYSWQKHSRPPRRTHTVSFNLSSTASSATSDED